MPNQLSPSNNLFVLAISKEGVTVENIKDVLWEAFGEVTVVVNEYAGAMPLTTPGVSNNLKEQVVELLTADEYFLKDPPYKLTMEEIATQILNLILDTILARLGEIDFKVKPNIQNAEIFNMLIDEKLADLWTMITELKK